jgi:DNA-binding GntR family transcriptional regulator
MSPGQTTERVYDLLKAQIMSGVRRPGERLDPAGMANDLNASATPVRDALHQLLGERMVEAWPREGFKVPIPTEAALRDLYEWHGDLIDLLLRGQKKAARTAEPPPLAASAQPAERARSLFTAIANALGSEERRVAVVQAGDRLHRARSAEAAIFPDLAEEYGALAQAWSAANLGELRALLSRYHRRRARQVTPIVAQVLAAPSRI